MQSTPPTALGHNSAPPAPGGDALTTADRIRYSAIVLAGGACYGVLASVVKIAYGQGFSFAQVVCSQAVFAFLVFVLLAAFDRARGVRRQRLTRAQRVKLAAMGLVTAGTSTFYYLSLTFIPASVAITLLFQFTWIGLVFEVALTHRCPTRAARVAAVAIFIGTLFASGLVGGEAVGALHPLGIICGLVSAVCCATFMFLSGRIEVQLPVQQRGLWACCGYLAFAFVLCPDYLSSGVLLQGIAPFGVVLGILGFALPMMLFGIGCARLSPGLSTIMASSELPISVACSVTLLQEVVTPLQIVGVAVILGGVVVAQLPALRKR